MHYFSYQKDELYAEEVPIKDIVAKYGSPVYIYSKRTLVRHFEAYKKAFEAIPHVICYAVKACSNIAILNIFAKLGSGADIVSGGELYRALKAKIPSNKIIYAGVGKTADEIAYALKSKILSFNVESEAELKQINQVAKSLNVQAPVSLRINPDIDAGTHKYISTGMKENKFGIPIKQAIEIYQKAMKMPHIDVVGIHMHIGSQLTKLSPFVDSFKRVINLYEKLAKLGINIKYIDIGGGLGIPYKDEKPPLPSELAKAIIPHLKDKDITLLLEPGRSIVGNAGILVTSVIYHKNNAHKDFIIVDTAMNDLIRPSLYEAYHEILPVKKSRKKTIIADIVGPICESGDFIAKARKVPALQSGDLLAVMSAGAYGFSMSSNYNSRPRVAEVLVDGKDFALIRKRETYEDLIRGESIIK